MDSKEKFNLAHHEGGHTVVGCAQGFELEFVTIVPAPGASEGSTKFVPEEVPETEAVNTAERRLVSTFAGFVGAVVCYVESNPTLSDEEINQHIETQLQVAGFNRKDGEKGDAAEIRELLKILQEAGQDPDACKLWAIQKANYYVSHNLAAIKALATNLLQRETLWWWEVNAILKPFKIVARRGPAGDVPMSYREMYR